MPTATRQSNLFELRCDGIRITYATSSFAGPPQLSYAGPEGERSFSGDEIESLPSALGTEVTVTLDSVPDLHTITLTLLLPAIDLPVAGGARFDALAIVSTHPVPLAGTAGQTYEALTMHGLATSVDF